MTMSDDQGGSRPRPVASPTPHVPVSRTRPEEATPQAQRSPAESDLTRPAQRTLLGLGAVQASLRPLPGTPGTPGRLPAPGPGPSFTPPLATPRAFGQAGTGLDVDMISEVFDFELEEGSEAEDIGATAWAMSEALRTDAFARSELDATSGMLAETTREDFNLAGAALLDHTLQGEDLLELVEASEAGLELDAEVADDSFLGEKTTVSLPLSLPEAFASAPSPTGAGASPLAAESDKTTVQQVLRHVLEGDNSSLAPAGPPGGVRGLSFSTQTLDAMAVHRQKTLGAVPAVAAARPVPLAQPVVAEPHTRLLLTHGPAKGQVLAMLEAQSAVGRGRDASHAVSDEALSRRHFALKRQSDGRLILEDLGSANGTHLNGTRVQGPQVLFHDDVIEAGKSTFRVIMATGGPTRRHTTPAPSPVAARARIAPEHTPVPGHAPWEADAELGPQDGAAPAGLAYQPIWRGVAMAAGALSAVLLVALGLMLGPGQERMVEQQRLSSQRHADRAYLHAVDAMRRQDWSEAQKSLKMTAELRADFPGLAAEQEQVRQESEAQGLFQQGRSALERGQWRQAQEAWERIPMQSAYRTESGKLLREFRERETQALLEQARGARSLGNLEDARERLEALLAIWPEHPDAVALLRSVQSERERPQGRARRP